MTEAVDLSHLLPEATGETREITLGAEKFELPSVFPMGVAILLERGKIGEGLALLVGEDNVDRFAPFFSDDVLSGICTEVYGLNLGESSASRSSSPKRGTSSRRTSSGSTGSPSRK